MVVFLGFSCESCKEGTEAQHCHPDRMGLSHNLGILHSLFHPQRPRTLCQKYYPLANCRRRWIRTIPGPCLDPSLGKPADGPRLAQCVRHRCILFFGITTTTTVFKQPCGLFICLSRCYFSFKFCCFPCLHIPPRSAGSSPLGILNAGSTSSSNAPLISAEANQHLRLGAGQNSLTSLLAYPAGVKGVTRGA